MNKPLEAAARALWDEGTKRDGYDPITLETFNSPEFDGIKQIQMAEARAGVLAFLRAALEDEILTIMMEAHDATVHPDDARELGATEHGMEAAIQALIDYVEGK